MLMNSDGIQVVCDAMESAKALVESTDSMRLPEALLKIEEEAFAGSSAAEYRLSEATTYIGSRAFADNPHLRIVIIPAADVQISDTAFQNDDSVILVCRSDSNAWRFALQHSLPYLLLEQEFG